jgi:hypothetical protein
MIFSITNFALLVALVIVSALFGYSIGKKLWFNKGVDVGIELGAETAKAMVELIKERYGIGNGQG